MTESSTADTLPAPGSTERTTIRRLAEKTVNDRATAYAILDAGFVAHVAVVDDERAAVRRARRVRP